MIVSSLTASQTGLMNQMTDVSIKQSLLQFFRDRFDVEPPSTDTDLIEAGILDSLMLIELVVYIEEQFQVATELDDLEMDNFLTVDDMARFVAARLPSAGGDGVAVSADQRELSVAAGGG
jgi:acyl carrier protein